MKNVLESVAIFFVGLLSLSIVYFIVQYNLVEDESLDDTVSFTIPQKKVTQKAKDSNYLDTLEGYGDDVDVKVDPTKDNRVNTVVVRSEIQKDDLGDIVDDKSKTSYMENLENYTEKSVETANVETVNIEKTVSDKVSAPAKTPVNENTGEPEKLPEDEIEDEIGMAIDAALSDL